MGRILQAEFVDSYSTYDLPVPPSLAQGFLFCPMCLCQMWNAQQMAWMQFVYQVAAGNAYEEFARPRLPRLSLN